MNTIKIYITAVLLLITSIAFSNVVFISGVVTEKHNDGFRMEGAKVEITDANTQEVLETLGTDNLGKFSTKVKKGRSYGVKVLRKNFLPCVRTIDTKELSSNQEVFFALKMERKPGYVFDVTLTERNKKGTASLEAIEGARIEVYNNTTQKSELEYINYTSSRFDFIFESGNYYTIMIRKDGYFNKRIEAYIDIEDCILCFDGLDVRGPELLGSTMKDNKRGAFLADITLEPIEIDKTIEIENIYYDFNQAYIRKDAASELDKLTTILRDNQHVLVELGSHTDARGGDEYNMKLSDARAKAAVEYLTSKAGISAERMTWKGYGESQLVNNCGNGINCPEANHEKNRRTTLKIVGTLEDPLQKKSLKEIIQSGKKMELMAQEK